MMTSWNCLCSKRHVKLVDGNIRKAVRLWRDDQAEATAMYGHINKWNTSKVTDMSYLFFSCECFNDNISEWDVSSVSDMSCMFYNASSFNQYVSEWDVSKVTNMNKIFYYASSFDRDVSEWDVSNVTNMSCMFWGASSFNQDVSGWDVSNVTNMGHMFYGALSFNQDVSGWNVSNVTNMSYMFYGAMSFNQNVSNWDISSFQGDVECMMKYSTISYTLMEFMNVGSFFEGYLRAIPCEQRRDIFAVLFPWGRRKGYVLFLVNLGYLQSSSTQSLKQSNDSFACDKLFDIEDLSRLICTYL